MFIRSKVPVCLIYCLIGVSLFVFISLRLVSINNNDQPVLPSDEFFTACSNLDNGCDVAFDIYLWSKNCTERSIKTWDDYDYDKKKYLGLRPRKIPVFECEGKLFDRIYLLMEYKNQNPLK
jgi:hypothetical protein